MSDTPSTDDGIPEGAAICPNCKSEIEPDLCYCGTSKEYHDPWQLGHSFVPLGCACNYATNNYTENNETL